MHDLAVRNQDDALSPVEKDELFAFGRAGDLLAILKSKARHTLGVKPGRSTTSWVGMEASLIRLMWRRADGRCEYCRLP